MGWRRRKFIISNKKSQNQNKAERMNKPEKTKKKKQFQLICFISLIVITIENSLVTPPATSTKSYLIFIYIGTKKKSSLKRSTHITTVDGQMDGWTDGYSNGSIHTNTYIQPNMHIEYGLINYNEKIKE